MIQCDKPGGETFQPGDIQLHPDAWLLCMPGYRNAPARFKPADEETAAKVADELAKQQPVVDQTKVYLQTKINGYADSGKYTIDPATGFFKRDADGVLVDKMSPLIAHVIETADGYGLKPDLE